MGCSEGPFYQSHSRLSHCSSCIRNGASSFQFCSCFWDTSFHPHNHARQKGLSRALCQFLQVVKLHFEKISLKSGIITQFLFKMNILNLKLLKVWQRERQHTRNMAWCERIQHQGCTWRGRTSYCHLPEASSETWNKGSKNRYSEDW